MRLSRSLLIGTLALVNHQGAGFASPRAMSSRVLAGVIRNTARFLSASTDDCGCTQFSGKPSEKAQSLNARQAVRSSTFYTVNGQPTTMDDLIGPPENGQTSVVVFLRSLG
jgi:hypothetical protein